MGCSDGEESEPCKLEPALDKLQPAVDVDCGQVGYDADENTNEVARKCVLDARASGKTFRVQKVEAAIDSTVVTVYVGGDEGTVSMLQYSNDAFAAGGAASAVYEYACDDLRARPASCEQAWISLCLECVNAGAPKLLCRGPLAR
jgi:hypothetical protein